MVQPQQHITSNVALFRGQIVGAGCRLGLGDWGKQAGRWARALKAAVCRRHRYLRAFAQQYSSELMYLTDAGTTADKHCLARLTTFMETNQDYAAVTGYQRMQVSTWLGTIPGFKPPARTPSGRALRNGIRPAAGHA